jgi:hypothetical protein
MSASTPKTSPIHTALMPIAGFGFPDAFSGSTSVVPPPNVTPTNGRICFSAAAADPDKATAAAAATPMPRVRFTRYLVNSPRNSFANGDTVTSPAASGNGRLSPWLFASRISVWLRRGSVSISDEDALSPTPNCQTTGSPL